MQTILPFSFFRRPALVVARNLLGKHLVRRVKGVTVAVPITEVEAYVGPHDKACHAFHGRTPRTDVMYGPGGVWYVYFVYGMHWMLNVVTGDAGHPAAVLLRAAGDWDGPGKLTKALAIDGKLNGKPSKRLSGLWIEDRGLAIPKTSVRRTPRIGVAYAEDWALKPYRFVLEDVY